MPCHGCDKIYVGETSLKLKDRIYQHRYALKTNNLNNALVTHRENTSHAIDLNGAKINRNQTDQKKTQDHRSRYHKSNENHETKTRFL